MIATIAIWDWAGFKAEVAALFASSAPSQRKSGMTQAPVMPATEVAKSQVPICENAGPGEHGPMALLFPGPGTDVKRPTYVLLKCSSYPPEFIQDNGDDSPGNLTGYGKAKRIATLYETAHTAIDRFDNESAIRALDEMLQFAPSVEHWSFAGLLKEEFIAFHSGMLGTLWMQRESGDRTQNLRNARSSLKRALDGFSTIPNSPRVEGEVQMLAANLNFVDRLLQGQ